MLITMCAELGLWLQGNCGCFNIIYTRLTHFDATYLQHSNPGNPVPRLRRRNIGLAGCPHILSCTLCRHSQLFDNINNTTMLLYLWSNTQINKQTNTPTITPNKHFRFTYLHSLHMTKSKLRRPLYQPRKNSFWKMVDYLCHMKTKSWRM